MVRKLPTTMALAYAEYDAQGIKLYILWAGDSRVYLLDEDGLAQLTADDTDVQDAFENLWKDGVMNNALSADGNYVIHEKEIYIDRPTFIFAATDGCFGYVASPMEFEYIFLDALASSDTPESFQSNLSLKLRQYAEDDVAMGIMSFYFGTFTQTKASLSHRTEYIEKNYIHTGNVERAEDHEMLRTLWKTYRPSYERYLNAGAE